MTKKIVGLIFLTPLLLLSACGKKEVKKTNGIKPGVYKKADKIMLVFEAPEGTKTVAVTGDFNSWDTKGISLTIISGNLWKVILQLQNGIYQYKYLVDGKEVLDPNAEAYSPDGKGGKNAVVEMDYEPDTNQ